MRKLPLFCLIAVCAVAAAAGFLWFREPRVAKFDHRATDATPLEARRARSVEEIPAVTIEAPAESATACSIAVRVIDSAGGSVIGACVTVADELAPRALIVGADGVAEFEVSPGARLRMLAQAEDFNEKIVEIDVPGKPGRHDASVTLDRAPTMRAHLIWADGAPAAGVECSLYGVPPTPEGMSRLPATTSRSDSNGLILIRRPTSATRCDFVINDVARISKKDHPDLDIDANANRVRFDLTTPVDLGSIILVPVLIIGVRVRTAITEPGRPTFEHDSPLVLEAKQGDVPVNFAQGMTMVRLARSLEKGEKVNVKEIVDPPGQDLSAGDVLSLSVRIGETIRSCNCRVQRFDQVDAAAFPLVAVGDEPRATLVVDPPRDSGPLLTRLIISRVRDYIDTEVVTEVVRLPHTIELLPGNYLLSSRGYGRSDAQSPIEFPEIRFTAKPSETTRLELKRVKALVPVRLEVVDEFGVRIDHWTARLDRKATKFLPRDGLIWGTPGGTISVFSTDRMSTKLDLPLGTTEVQPRVVMRRADRVDEDER